jgi:hypothetical protein
MAPKVLKSVALGLAFGIVLMLAASTGTAFVHELQHATHHNARMHATGVCAWMCASAGTVITPVFLPVSYTVVQRWLLPLERQHVSLIFASRLQARAPPSLL